MVSIFHAYCVVHPKREVRRKYWQDLTQKNHIHPVDIWLTESDTITIADIRNFKKQIFYKPFASACKAAVIEVEKLTPEAQPALLKTVEEPPQNSLIIFSTPRLDLLLPTLVSRCQIIKLSDSITTIDSVVNIGVLRFWQDVFSQSIGQRLLLSKNLSQDRQELASWLQQHIQTLRQVLYQTYLSSPQERAWPPLVITQTLKLLTTAYQHLYQNVQIKLITDQLLINSPKTSF